MKNLLKGLVRQTVFAASSLVESMVAIVILTIAGTATFMTIGWVISSNSLVLQLRTEGILRAAAQETKKTARFFDETIESKEWVIHRKLSPVPGLPNACLMNFTARNNAGKTIATYEELIWLRR